QYLLLFCSPRSPERPASPSFPTRRSSDLHFADVRATLDRFDHALPRSPGRLVLRARAAFAERDYEAAQQAARRLREETQNNLVLDRKSTRLNSSHVATSYAVFCLKKKRK